jgi:hypothetical protein
VRDVVGDLEAGRNVVVLLPATAGTDALRTALRREIRARELGPWDWLWLTDTDTLDASPPAALARELLPSWGPPDALHDAAFLAGAEPLAGRVICLGDLEALPGERTQRWCQFLADYGQAIRNRSLLERAVFCVIARGLRSQDCPREDVLISRRWWWGAVSRLDVSLYVRETTLDDPAMDACSEAAIVELAGFDPALAATLIAAWRRGEGDLCAVIRSCFASAERMHDRESNPTPYAQVQIADSAVPRSDLEPLWARGWLDALRREGLHVNSAALAAWGDEAGLRQRLWKGQVRVLLPLIDEHRARLCRYLAKRYGPQVPHPVGDASKPGRGSAGASWLDLEIGQIKRLFDAAQLLYQEPDAVRTVVRWLHFARNELAHLRPLDQATVTRGLRLLETVRF